MPYKVFIHSVHKYLVNIYYVPGTDLEPSDKAVNKIKQPMPSWNLQSSIVEKHVKISR